jgi:hypothetical protein
VIGVERVAHPIANDESSPGFQSLKERGEGAARRKKNTTRITVPVLLSMFLSKMPYNKSQMKSLQTSQILLAGLSAV